MIIEEKISTVKVWVKSLTDDELEFAHTETIAERNRRRNRQIVDQGVVEAVTELRAAGVLPTPGETEDPQPWEDPGTTHTKMYLLGDVITHNGKTYRSNHPGLNHWEPGSAGIDYRIWEEVVWEEDPEDGVIEFRAGVAVVTGDIVRYDGVLYEVLQDHTLADHWPPPEVANLFSKV